MIPKTGRDERPEGEHHKNHIPSDLVPDESELVLVRK